MNRIRKKFKTIKSVGLKPSHWLLEVCAYLISKKKINAQCQTNPYLDTITNSTIEPHDFTFTSAAIIDNPEKITHALNLYGICLLTDFLDHETAISAGQQLTSFLSSDKCKPAMNSKIKEYAEEDRFIWQTDYAWSDNYVEVAQTPKPVINIRARDNQQDDAGMVDIFGIERLAKNEDLTDISQCTETMSRPAIKNILSTISGYKQRQFNCYINRGITRTRGPHIDNNSAPYKLFVYLTDVENENDGPYCYLPTSHKNRQWMSYERLYNAVTDKPSTEVSSIERKQLVKLFGKAGTAIITNQSGVHCGWPQDPDGQRALLVSNYY